MVLLRRIGRLALSMWLALDAFHAIRHGASLSDRGRQHHQRVRGEMTLRHRDPLAHPLILAGSGPEEKAEESRFIGRH